MRALHVRLTFAFALLLAGLAVGLLLLLSRTSDRYSDEVLQRLNSGIASYVVRGCVKTQCNDQGAHFGLRVSRSAR